MLCSQSGIYEFKLLTHFGQLLIIQEQAAIEVAIGSGCVPSYYTDSVCILIQILKYTTIPFPSKTAFEGLYTSNYKPKDIHMGFLAVAILINYK